MGNPTSDEFLALARGGRMSQITADAVIRQLDKKPPLPDPDAGHKAKLREKFPDKFGQPKRVAGHALTQDAKGGAGIQLHRGPVALPLGRVLSIDPSSSSMGWALLHSGRATIAERIDSGFFHPKQNAAKNGDKYTQQLAFLDRLFERFSPGWVVVEVPHRKAVWTKKMSGMSIAAYGRAIQLALCAAYYHRTPYLAATAEMWKGTAAKAFTRLIVKRDLRYWPDEKGDGWADEMDALGVGLWFVKTNGGAGGPIT